MGHVDQVWRVGDSVPLIYLKLGDYFYINMVRSGCVVSRCYSEIWIMATVTKYTGSRNIRESCPVTTVIS